jgi:hypothetical protein
MFISSFFIAGGYSPRHRFACRPSLSQAIKRVIPFFLFLNPLYAKGEERVVGRSHDRVSNCI